jgi:heme-degrading monooxygenase HmoA
MIVRSWRGWASPEKAHAYEAHFSRNVVPELKAVPGFLGASLLKAQQAARVEFLVLTRWASFDAVKAFAGTDYAKAVVEPEAVAALMDFERTVQHYKLAEDVAVTVTK